MAVYKNQSFKQSLETGIDLTTYTSIAMKYRKSDGIDGEWQPSVSSPETGGVIYYEIPKDTLDVVGTWQVWSEVVNTSGTFYGNPVPLIVKPEGVRITNKDFVKSYLGITAATYDDKIEALIPLMEAMYLDIRNAPWELTGSSDSNYTNTFYGIGWEEADPSRIVYPAGSNVTIAEMIGYKISQGSGYNNLTSETTLTYSWSSDGKTAYGFPMGIVKQIRRYVNAQ